MTRYVPKTVREYGRIYLAECLARQGWQCFIARRSPNEDEVIAGIPAGDAVAGDAVAGDVAVGVNNDAGAAREVRVKFHAQENRQAIRFYDADTLDWDWQCLVITTGTLDDAPVTYLLLREDVQAANRLESEFGGALWLQPDVFADADFREAWHKLAAAPYDLALTPV